jgi:hypothetical protein
MSASPLGVIGDWCGANIADMWLNNQGLSEVRLGDDLSVRGGKAAATLRG